MIICPDLDCAFGAVAGDGEGLPVVVVDEEIYRLLPSMIIGTVDKFAQLPWKGETLALFGRVSRRCERHGYVTDDLAETDWENTSHPADRKTGAPAARTVGVTALRPPDLIIQDELHLISGPLGSLTGLYKTAVDRLATWENGSGRQDRPKVIASTATVRRAPRQIEALFYRRTEVFPPSGLDADDSFFARARPTRDAPNARPGRRYVGICAHGTRIRSTRLTRAQERGLARRYDPLVTELTSRLSSGDIPAVLDQLAVPFTASRGKGDRRPIDVLLATNMISVGVDVSRLGIMVVAGQPKSTAEYIQATSRVGRNDPGLVFTVFNWARARDLSHYETFDHFHATFYRQIEALSVTPFADRAVDRGLTGVLVALLRNLEPAYNANLRAQDVDRHSQLADHVVRFLKRRAADVAGENRMGDHVERALDERLGLWARERAQPARQLAYEQPAHSDNIAGLLRRPDDGPWRMMTCPTSLRDVEPGIRLLLRREGDDPIEEPPFTTRNGRVPRGKGSWLGQVVLVPRLREVAALYGFTRIDAPEWEVVTTDERQRVPLRGEPPSWVPCAEMRGEGLFLRLTEEQVAAWEARAPVVDRARRLFAAHAAWRAQHKLPPDQWPGIRYVLLHTFAHVLIRQFALECGYNAAGIAEHVYARAAADGRDAMAGVLLYTAAPDSEGTLGGLVSLGDRDRLGALVDQALETARLCSSDPLCAEHDPRTHGRLSAAACHACLFAAETSCERGNHYLDRALLVDTIDGSGAGFFAA
ncbi:hypothetical protein FDG2_5171 [Candidatus Protofrankia californiensis]|uniref:Helicase C-terminal domain-containing protein n=1 Tax=Candidatus Protofrankia californiensis TaxID=1839754 RepID=A0A1C3PBB9_9ACTN|nr:hypothetical protein FDG2_5171 [Candidatus Protofrankia californiensis]